jgi:hypothetical protein
VPCGQLTQCKVWLLRVCLLSLHVVVLSGIVCCLLCQWIAASLAPSLPLWLACVCLKYRGGATLSPCLLHLLSL